MQTTLTSLFSETDRRRMAALGSTRGSGAPDRAVPQSAAVRPSPAPLPGRRRHPAALSQRSRAPARRLRRRSRRRPHRQARPRLGRREPHVQGAAATRRQRNVAEVETFFANLPRFAFYDDLAAAVRQLGQSLEDRQAVVRALLAEPGLGYAETPKALLKFHRENGEVRTAVEEHLVEAAAIDPRRGRRLPAPSHRLAAARRGLHRAAPGGPAAPRGARRLLLRGHLLPSEPGHRHSRRRSREPPLPPGRRHPPLPPRRPRLADRQSARAGEPGLGRGAAQEHRQRGARLAQSHRPALEEAPRRRPGDPPEADLRLPGEARSRSRPRRSCSTRSTASSPTSSPARSRRKTPSPAPRSGRKC